MIRHLCYTAVLLAPTTAMAGYQVYTDTDGDGIRDCGGSTFSSGSLQAAVNATGITDILLVDGTNTESSEVSVTADLVMRNDGGTCASSPTPGSIARSAPAGGASTTGRLLNVSGASLTITALSISGGHASGDGGTIIVANNGATNGALNLNKTHVSGGQATGDGGCIHATNSNVTMAGDPPSTVSSCEADGDGGGLYLDAGDHVLQTVSSNVAGGDGGGAFLAPTATAKGGNINDNNAAGHGGGIRVDDAAFTLEAGTVLRNFAELDGGGIHADNGGEVFVTPRVTYTVVDDDCDYLSVKASTICDNGAGYENATTSTSTAQYGGGVYLDDALLEADGLWDDQNERVQAEICDNRATESGGGIAATGGSSVALRATDIWGNEAEGADGGGVYIDDASAAYVDTTDPWGLFGTHVFANSAAEHGGGVRATGADSEVGLYYLKFAAPDYLDYWDSFWGLEVDAKCPYSPANQPMHGSDEHSYLGQVGTTNAGWSNIATQNGGGASIDVGASLELGADTRRNLANEVYDGSGSGVGGGIHLDGATFLAVFDDPRRPPPSTDPRHLTSIAVTANAAKDGGGVWIDDTPDTELPTGLQVNNNRVNGLGAGLYVGPDAIVSTGAMYDSNGSAQDEPSTPGVDESIQTIRGGGIAVDNGEVDIDGGTISNNRATEGGGVSAVGSAADVDVADPAKIHANHAEDTTSPADGNGGGVFIDGSADVTVGFGVEISDNDATDEGGGVALHSGTFTAGAAEFEGNSAALGGAVAVAAGTASIAGATLIGNGATQGGGVAVTGGSAGINGAALLEANGASAGGGAWISGGTLIVRKATFLDNEAGSSGGGLYASGGIVELGDDRDPAVGGCPPGSPCVEFLANLAYDDDLTPTAGEGGAMSIDGEVEVVGHRLLMADNEAVTDGAAIYITNDLAEVELINTAVVSNGGYLGLSTVAAVQVDDGALDCIHCTSGHNDHAFELSGASTASLDLRASIIAEHGGSDEFVGLGTPTGGCVVVETSAGASAISGTNVVADSGVMVDDSTGKPNEELGDIGRLVNQCDTSLDLDVHGDARPVPATTLRDRGAYELECGDGVRQSWEECDDAATDNGGPCLMTCVSATCGDGHIEVGEEECDDDNTTAGDGCDSSCMREIVCGDGVTEGTEDCDDGNPTSGDGCSDVCELEGLVGINGAYCAYDSVNEAVVAASAGDTIYVADHLVGANARITSSLPNDLTIESAVPDCTAPSVTYPNHLYLVGTQFVDTGSSDFTLRNIEIHEGGSDTIASSGGSLTLDQVMVNDSTNDAIVVTDTTVTITDSQLLNAGGVALVVDEASGTSTVDVSDTKFDKNDQAIVVDAGTVDVADSEVYNHVTAPAVTATSSDAALNVRRTRIQFNATGGGVAFVGAAAHAEGGGSVLLENVLVTGHPAGGPAVGAADSGSLMDVVHGTVADNGGRGMEVTASADLAVTNSIDRSNGSPSRTALGTTLTADCVNMTRPVGGGTKTSIAPVFPGNPMFNADYTLNAASDSVDQCTSGTRPDLDGNDVVGDYDQGALELQ